jgi:hypothetical protein
VKLATFDFVFNSVPPPIGDELDGKKAYPGQSAKYEVKGKSVPPCVAGAFAVNDPPRIAVVALEVACNRLMLSMFPEVGPAVAGSSSIRAPLAANHPLR